MQRSIYEAWSNVLRYPGEGRAERISTWIDEILAVDGELADRLDPLAAFACTHTEGEVEEAFVRTFENNAERALELGWHLHGENYARGAFMVRLRGLLRDNGIAETCELPDHLSHVLLVLARGEAELADALANQVVLPALEKILDGFKDGENPYRGVLRALRQFLRNQHSPTEMETAR